MGDEHNVVANRFQGECVCHGRALDEILERLDAEEDYMCWVVFVPPFCKPLIS